MKGKPIEPGCLAMIVGAPRTPENNGKVVRVIRLADPKYIPPVLIGYANPSPSQNVQTWVVRSERGPELIVQTYSVRRGRDHVLRRAFCDERSFAAPILRRLDDGEDYSHETDETTKHNLEQTS